MLIKWDRKSCVTNSLSRFLSYNKAITVYEECISESRAQVRAIFFIIRNLYSTTIFGYENHETLANKCAIHSSRLLKRADQCLGILMVSHLFWADTDLKRPDDKPAIRNPRRVIECLQKALKIADSVMDHVISVGLFVQILEKYLWYFEKGNDQITYGYINSLVELIHDNLLTSTQKTLQMTSFGGALSVPAPRTASSKSKDLKESAALHFLNILNYITTQKQEHRLSTTGHISGFDTGFGSVEGKWGSINTPHFDVHAVRHSD